MDGFRLFFAASGPTKRRNHYLCLLFPQYCVCSFPNISRNPNLRTSPKNQFQDYHAWNRIEKLMPLNWNFSPQTFKTLQKTANVFSNLDFLPKSGFLKTLDLSMDFPWIPPPPRIFGEAAGAADKKCGGVLGGAGAPPHESGFDSIFKNSSIGPHSQR